MKPFILCLDDMLSEFPSADQVEMDVHHRLSGSGSAVVDHPVAFGKPFRSGDLRDRAEARGHGRGVFKRRGDLRKGLRHDR